MRGGATRAPHVYFPKVTMKPVRSLVLTLALLGAPAPAAAQGADVRGTPTRDSIMLDRIVAIVGKKVITLSELYQTINEERANREMDPRAPKLPTDTIALKRTFLDDMIDTELLLQKADALKLTVTDEEMAPTVDKQLEKARGGFRTEAEYLKALHNGRVQFHGRSPETVPRSGTPPPAAAKNH